MGRQKYQQQYQQRRPSKLSRPRWLFTRRVWALVTSDPRRTTRLADLLNSSPDRVDNAMRHIRERGLIEYPIGGSGVRGTGVAVLIPFAEERADQS